MCKCCDYSTEDKSNFNKHITSRKHKLVESKSNISNGPDLVENYQDKLNNLVELVQIMNDRLEKQEKQINEQKIQIDYINSELF
jgi:methyl-accepting chemotaxis protein